MKLNFALLFMSVGAAATGCVPRGTGTNIDGGVHLLPDLIMPVNFGDGFSDPNAPDLSLNRCGNSEAMCHDTAIGPNGMAVDPKATSLVPTFPLLSDGMPDPNVPNESDTGVGRDAMGYLQLDSMKANFDFLWVANTNDWNRGSISKIDAKKIKELARYLTVTCYSNFGTGASKAACDGTKGCCSADDYARFSWRQTPMGPLPTHQTVDQNNTMPSRTAMDYNGDVFVANRAFMGQSSVTKIANDLGECRDYNGNKKIDTSSDLNGDGLIQTDCNNNGYPDDLDDVKTTPCKNGIKEEFFGLDDECILWTTNTNVRTVRGRPLTLGPGDIDGGPSDAWAGSWRDGQFFRLDALTGKTKAVALGPKYAYGATTDANGIVWIAATDGADAGRLGYFDTANPLNVSTTRSATFPLNAYGIALDRDQNIWQGGWLSGNAYRYTPNRTNFTTLGAGSWTVVQTPGANAGATGSGRGITVDNRNAMGGSYFAWMARDSNGLKITDPAGWIVRIDASGIPLPKGGDTMFDGSKFPAMQVSGTNTVGVGIDVEQNVWGISNVGAVITRIPVDLAGNMSAPNIPKNQVPGCPGGDTCVLADSKLSDPQPYTYSDFTGYGLRNINNPKGNYSFVIAGCADSAATQPEWDQVAWDADVPMGTSLTVRLRTGPELPPGTADQMGNLWGLWTAVQTTTPFNISPKGKNPIMPNGDGDGKAKYMQVEIIMTTTSRSATPKLKTFDVAYKCFITG